MLLIIVSHLHSAGWEEWVVTRCDDMKDFCVLCLGDLDEAYKNRKKFVDDGTSGMDSDSGVRRKKSTNRYSPSHQGKSGKSHVFFSLLHSFYSV
jgi:hypothetical protein